MAEEESELQIELDGKSYRIEDFSLGDLEWLEDEMGVPFAEIDFTSMKAAVRFIYLVKRRDNEEYSLDDARAEKLNIFRPEENGNGERPTGRGKKKAASGRQT